MNLKTRPVILATAALTALAAGIIIWQVAKSPSTTPGNAVATAPNVGSASGLVTPAQVPTQTATPPRAAGSAAANDAGNAAASAAATGTASAAAASARGTTSAQASATAAASATVRSSAATPAGPASVIKHRVAPTAVAAPPVLPNEVNAAAAKALGGKRPLLRLFYLEPLARRVVASIDGLGNKEAPTELWLLKPAPGELKLLASSKQPDKQLIKRANSQRYARFMNWVVRTDNTKLLTLYARMYPLLQQTYVDLGHADGYFNDRVIEVIDLMLATPTAKPPLLVQKASADKQPAKPSSTGLQRTLYEFSDPALESLATGQKLLLRMGTQNAALLKLKLKALRQGLIKLGHEAKPKKN